MFRQFIRPLAVLMSFVMIITLFTPSQAYAAAMYFSEETVYDGSDMNTIQPVEDGIDVSIPQEALLPFEEIPVSTEPIEVVPLDEESVSDNIEAVSDNEESSDEVTTAPVVTLPVEVTIPVVPVEKPTEEVVITLPTEPITVSENKLYGTPVSEAGQYRIYDIEAEWNEELMTDVSGGDEFTPDMVTLRPVLYWYDGDGNLDKDTDRHPVTYGEPLTEEEYTYKPTTFVAGDYTYIGCTYNGKNREPLADGTLLSENGTFGFEYFVRGQAVDSRKFTGLEADYVGGVKYAGDKLTCSDFSLYAFFDVTYSGNPYPQEDLERIYDNFTITPDTLKAGENEIQISYTIDGVTKSLYEPVVVNGLERTIAGNLSGAKIGTIKKQLYTGYPICPAPKVTYKKKTLAENVDYVLSYENNVEEGTATVTIAGIGSYEGSISKTFTIYKNDIKKASVKSIAKQLYTGSQITPELTVKYSGKALVEGKDYEVSFASNIEEGKASVTITGLGAYKGSKQVTFSIYKVKIGSCKISGVSTMAYTGNESSVILPLSITYKGNTLVEGTDYSLTYANNNGPGKASVTITGLGSYKGSVTKNFTIKDYSTESWKMKLSATSFLYTGEAVEPKITVTCKSGTLTYGTHYTVRYDNNVNEGTAKASVLDMSGNVVLEKTFTIYKADLSKASIKGLVKQQYTGEALTPQFSVVYKKQTLTEGLHYTVSYSNNTEVGKATVTINAGEGGKGSKTAKFSIYKVKMSSVKADKLYDYPYTGREIIPSVRLTYKGISLVEGIDYKVDVTKNVNPGKGQVVVTGLKGYTGTKKLKFTITKPSMSDMTFTGVKASYERIGAYTVNEYKELKTKKMDTFEIRPEVTVTVSGTPLTKDADYTVSYQNTKKVGTASVTIKGKGIYSGTRVLYFAITGGKTPLESLIEDTYGKKVDFNSESSVKELMAFLEEYGITSMDHVYDGVNAPGLSIESVTVKLNTETPSIDMRTPLNWEMQKERILDPVSYYGIDKIRFEVWYNGTQLEGKWEYYWDYHNDINDPYLFGVTIRGANGYTGTKDINFFDIGLEKTDSGKGQKGYDYLSYCEELEKAYGGSIVSEEYGTDWYNPPQWFVSHNLHLDDWYDHKVDGTPYKKGDGSHNLPQYKGVAETDFTLVLIDTTYDSRTPLNWSMMKEKVYDPVSYYGWDEIRYEIYCGDKLLLPNVDYTFEYHVGWQYSDYWGLVVTGIGDYKGVVGFNYLELGITHTDSTKNAEGSDFLQYVNELGFAYGSFLTNDPHPDYGTSWQNPPKWFFYSNLHLDDWYDNIVNGTPGWESDGSHKEPYYDDGEMN